MTVGNDFSPKAEKYAKYRWDYALAAVRYILNNAGLPKDATVADIGSGTGILTKHFLDLARCVYAVEPDSEMRRMAEQALADHSSFRSVAGQSERTTLPDHSIDLITVGQAIHWFDSEPTRAELLRILRPGGWLAILWNEGTDQELGEALKRIWAEENGCKIAAGANQREATPLAFYFGSDDFLTKCFPQSLSETWEQFFGGLCSASSSPNETHPRFARFEGAAREVFTRFASGDRITVSVSTEVRIGQPG